MTRLVESGFSKEHSVTFDADAGTITLDFSTDLTTGQTAILDAVMGAYDGFVYMEQLIRKELIDKNTRDLIAKGFMHSGHKFSLSLAAQANWNRMVAKHAAGKLTFPTDEVSTFYGARHTFTDAAAFEAFEDAYLAAIDSIIESGRLLKEQVDAAATVEEVNAVIDTR